MVDIVIFSDEVAPDKSEFDSFEEAAAEVRVYLVPEIANAIDDMLADGESDITVKQLTQLLCDLCSPDNQLVVEAIKEWQRLVVDFKLGTLWIQLRQD